MVQLLMNENMYPPQWQHGLRSGGLWGRPRSRQSANTCDYFILIDRVIGKELYSELIGADEIYTLDPQCARLPCAAGSLSMHYRRPVYRKSRQDRHVPDRKFGAAYG